MARRLMIIALILLLVTTPCLAATEEQYKQWLLEAKEIIEGYQALLAEKEATIDSLLEINAAKDIIIEDLQKQLKPKFGFAVGTELGVVETPKLILLATYSW